MNEARSERADEPASRSESEVRPEFDPKRYRARLRDPVTAAGELRSDSHISGVPSNHNEQTGEYGRGPQSANFGQAEVADEVAENAASLAQRPLDYANRDAAGEARTAGLEARLGVPRSLVEPGRYIDPGASVQAELLRKHTDFGSHDYKEWVKLINPNYDKYSTSGPSDSLPWQENCGEAARSFADAFQDVNVRAAWGDGRKVDGLTAAGELKEMWEWSGAVPHGRLENPEPGDSNGQTANEFTQSTWEKIEIGLRDLPVGTVAIVGVDWESPHPSVPREQAGGHWFNAVVSEHGVDWVDAQSGESAGWPPRYSAVWRAECIVRRPSAEWGGLEIV